MTFRAYNKYLVLKWDDVQQYLSQGNQDCLHALVAEIHGRRIRDGKPPWRNWVVVNADKPYGGEVWRLIKQDVEAGEKE